jgi:hypothetical protein
MAAGHKKLVELETALAHLRDDLNELSRHVNAEPTNTSLVIRRVNLMNRIMTAQAAVEQLRGGFAQL